MRISLITRLWLGSRLESSHKKTVRERENEGDRERGRQREERMAVLVKLALVLALLGAAACRETFHEWTKQVAAVEGS